MAIGHLLPTDFSLKCVQKVTFRAKVSLFDKIRIWFYDFL